MSWTHSLCMSTSYSGSQHPCNDSSDYTPLAWSISVCRNQSWLEVSGPVGLDRDTPNLKKLAKSLGRVSSRSQQLSSRRERSSYRRFRVGSFLSPLAPWLLLSVTLPAPVRCVKTASMRLQIRLSHPFSCTSSRRRAWHDHQWLCRSERHTIHTALPSKSVRKWSKFRCIACR